MPFTAGQTLRAADLISASAQVATQQTTLSTTYTDLTTAGPAVTFVVPASGAVEVTVTAGITNNAAANFSWMSFALSGANTVAAADSNGRFNQGTGTENRASVTTRLSGLTPGSTTFTAKYKVSAGTGSFQLREIIVRAAG